MWKFAHPGSRQGCRLPFARPCPLPWFFPSCRASSSRAWQAQEPGPALMSSTASTSRWGARDVTRRKGCPQRPHYIVVCDEEGKLPATPMPSALSLGSAACAAHTARLPRVPAALATFLRNPAIFETTAGAQRGCAAGVRDPGGSEGSTQDFRV